MTSTAETDSLRHLGMAANASYWLTDFMPGALEVRSVASTGNSCNLLAVSLTFAGRTSRRGQRDNPEVDMQTERMKPLNTLSL